MLERALIILTLALLWFAPPAHSEVLHLRDLSPDHFNSTLEVYEDTAGTLTLEDILDRDKAGLFKARKDLNKNGFGFTRSAIWVKTQILNDSSHTDWIVGSTRPDFNIMDVHVLDKNGSLLQTKQFGTSVRKRDLETRMPVGRITLEPGAFYTLYLKVKSPLQLSLTFILLDQDTYINYALHESIFYFAYFGTVIALILYNLFLFVFLRYRDYLFYVAFGMAMLINAYIQGGFAEYFHLELPFLGSTSDAFRILLFPAITSILYTRSFLRLKEIAPTLYRVMGYIVGLEIAFAIFLWTDLSFEFRYLVSTFDALAVILVFTGSILAIRKGDKSAKVFLLAWGILAICVAVWVMGNMGILEKSEVIANAPLFGNMCEMVLMSIALALRIKELDQKKVEAEMRAREKDNLQHLLRMVCHDISNPLSIIKTVVSISARKEMTPPEDSKQWSRVKRASDSIESIINQVRKYEEFRSGKMAFELKPCSVKKVFEDVEFFFGSRAADKGVELSSSFPEGNEDIMVMADGISLTHEVINNLVSNAIKFTPKGGSVKVEAMVRLDYVYISVIDNGIGMPPDVLSKIFDNQGYTTRFGTALEPGSGFGMPLVKTFLEMFHGQITVKSKEKVPNQDDHGTIITIKLLKATAEKKPSV